MSENTVNIVSSQIGNPLQTFFISKKSLSNIGLIFLGGKINSSVNSKPNIFRKSENILLFYLNQFPQVDTCHNW